MFVNTPTIQELLTALSKVWKKNSLNLSPYCDDYVAVNQLVNTKRINSEIYRGIKELTQKCLHRTIVIFAEFRTHRKTRPHFSGRKPARHNTRLVEDTFSFQQGWGTSHPVPHTPKTMPSPIENKNKRLNTEKVSFNYVKLFKNSRAWGHRNNQFPLRIHSKLIDSI